jgi:hypothetical protein
MDSKDSAVALFGSVPFTVHKTDGTHEEVTVLQLPIRKFRDLQARLNDECAQLELYCNKPEKWAEQLTPTSHEGLLEVAEGINKDFFLRWVEREKKREALIPKPDPEQLAGMISALSKHDETLLSKLIAGAAPSSNSSVKQQLSAG